MCYKQRILASKFQRVNCLNINIKLLILFFVSIVYLTEFEKSISFGLGMKNVKLILGEGATRNDR